MRRLMFAAILACSLSSGAVMFTMGDYNLFPAYCHTHSAWDPLWWVYQCWLPDDPDGAGIGG